MSDELRAALTDAVMVNVLMVVPAPDNFAGYVAAVRERLLIALRTALAVDKDSRKATPTTEHDAIVHDRVWSSGYAAGRAAALRKHKYANASEPCSLDLRCYRNDGHDGDHAYPTTSEVME